MLLGLKNKFSVTENTGSSNVKVLWKVDPYDISLDNVIHPRNLESLWMREVEKYSQEMGKKPHSLEMSDGILKVFSNCLCLAQLGKLSQFRTSLEHVVLCCWWSISVTWSWASHIWMGLGTCGNALSELRALFRGFHALAEVEKVYLENKECSLLHWFCVCLCVCSKSSVGHMRNCRI